MQSKSLIEKESIFEVIVK